MTKPVKQTTVQSQTQLELNRGEKLGYGLGYKKQ